VKFYYTKVSSPV